MTEKFGGKALFSTVKNGHVNKVGLCNKGAHFPIPNTMWPKSNTRTKIQDHLETKPIQAKMLTNSLPVLPYTSQWLFLGRRAREELSPTNC